jgi:hypothetical protein
MILFFDPSWASIGLLVTCGLTPLTEHVRLARVLGLPDGAMDSAGAVAERDLSVPPRGLTLLRPAQGILWADEFPPRGAGISREFRQEFGPMSGTAVGVGFGTGSFPDSAKYFPLGL